MPCHVRLLSRAALIPCAALTLMILAAGTARAQPSRVANDSGRNDVGTRQVTPFDLDKMKEPQKKSQDRRPAYRDVASEFERLQLANRSLAGLVKPDATADYADIRKRAAEVNKSASRLKAYLSLPKPDDEGKQRKGAGPLGPDGLRPAVASLEALVHGFVWNPILHHPDLVDSEKSMQASRDLEEIIGLSARIRKCAEGLMKNAGKR